MIDGPMARYRALIAEGEITADPAQRAAVEKLQLLHMRLKSYRPGRGRNSLRGWFGRRSRRAEEETPLGGVYMYGGVGRGKSMLMDLFFDGAPITPKRRVHFHAFMQEIHVGVHIARESNVRDPILTVAEEVAETAVLLCFDEFQVSDITDAMILGRLFEALFARGVVIVATSNRPPDDLYKDGLNRQVFVPFIEMLSRTLDVHELMSETDYRQGRTTGRQVFFSPLGPEAAREIEAAWRDETGGAASAPITLSVHGRRIVIPQTVEDVGRASFADLCEKPLGPADYLAIATQFGTFFLEGIPALTWAKSNEAKRLVTLIDAFYEAKVRFYCSSEVPPAEIYTDGKGAFEFARTASRLAEMQSEEYLAGLSADSPA